MRDGTISGPNADDRPTADVATSEIEVALGGKLDIPAVFRIARGEVRITCDREALRRVDCEPIGA